MSRNIALLRLEFNKKITKLIANHKCTSMYMYSSNQSLLRLYADCCEIRYFLFGASKDSNVPAVMMISEEIVRKII